MRQLMVYPPASRLGMHAALSQLILPSGTALRLPSFRHTQGARNPRYFTFPASTGFKEDPLQRDMRPTFPQLLELSRLATNFDLQRLPSIGRNTQVRGDRDWGGEGWCGERGWLTFVVM